MNETSIREALIVGRAGHEILLKPLDGCNGCHQASSCGLRSETADRLWSLPGEATLVSGCRVRIEAPPGLVRKCALAAYGLPLAGALLGAAAGRPFGEGLTSFGVLIGLTFGFWALRRWSRRAGLIAPRIVPIYDRTPIHHTERAEDVAADR